MRLIFLYSFTFLLLVKSVAQSPFGYRPEIAFPIGITALSLFGAERQIASKKKPKSVVFIESLKPEQVNKFDRSAIFQNNKGARIASDVMLFGSALIPLPLLADQRIRKDFGQVALMNVEVFLLNAALTNLVKTSVSRPRPYTYNPDLPIYKKRSKDSYMSFYSGHTSTASSQAFFAATIFTMYNPKNKYLPLVWAGAASFPIGMAFCRYKAGKHFWTDVIVGYLAGAVIGAGVPILHSNLVWKK
jgi:membrane-associated phospholipid phosphatase